jgi:hypothetical protein
MTPEERLQHHEGLRRIVKDAQRLNVAPTEAIPQPLIIPAAEQR